jgi:dolichol-phosphate mannosyltransferase
MKIGIVIPTYNEAENIVRLIEELNKLPWELDILVVDDDSPDNTSDLVIDRFKNQDNIFVLTRKKEKGRGIACIDGFKYLLNNSKTYDCIFEMDADFSHRPQDINLFLEKIKDFDIVIGSRFIKGGKVINLSLGRRLFSRLSNIYARLILKIPITDYTTGFRCYRYSLLKSFDFNLVEEKGYIVLSEMAYQIYLKGYSFGEVPIVFVNRQKGASKFNPVEIIQAFKRINILKYSLMKKLRTLKP